MSPPQKSTPIANVPPKRRRWRWFVIAVLAVLIGISFLPTLISKTIWRNSVINVLLGRPKLVAAAESATFSWLSDQQVGSLQIVDASGGVQIQIEQVNLDRSIWQLLTDSRDKGHLSLKFPQMTMVMAPIQAGVFLSPPPSRPRNDDSTISIAIDDGRFVLHDKLEMPAVVILDRLDLRMHIRNQGGERVFVAEPCTLLNQSELTEGMCHQGLQLIAPILADAANVTGNVSLRLDKLLIPLETSTTRTNELELEGHLLLHRVTAGARNPLLKELTQLVSRLLGRKIPGAIRIADGADVHFRVQQGRVFHEGFAFGLPEVSSDLQIRTKGWVGLDRSLDLQVDIPIPLAMLHDGSLLKKLSDRPLRFQIRGSLDKPLIGLPDDRRWYEELAKRLLSDSENSDPQFTKLEPLAESVLDTLGDLLERRRHKSDAAAKSNGSESRPDSSAPAPSLMDRFRGWRTQRHNQDRPNLSGQNSDETTNGSDESSVPANPKKPREF